jgi:hypothetical protein
VRRQDVVKKIGGERWHGRWRGKGTVLRCGGRVCSALTQTA